MSDSEELKKQKKREANKKYQEKIKRKLEEAEKRSRIGSEPRDPESEEEAEAEFSDQEAEPEETEERLMIDKKAYLYLLEKAKKGEAIEEPVKQVELKPKAPKDEIKEDPNSFFFLLKNSFKTTAISILPVVTLQLALHGGKLLTNLNSRSQSGNTLSQSNKQPQHHTMDFGLPSVNAL